MRSINGVVWGWALVLAAGAAQAQTNAASAVFKSADTNNDARIIQVEFDRYVKASTFARLDQDKDEVITLAEWKAADRSPEAQQHFEALDKDRNGRISYAEFLQAVDWKNVLNDSFKSLDRDQSGNLTTDEFMALPSFRLLSVNF